MSRCCLTRDLNSAADAHYHHLADDVVRGGKLEYRDGRIRVPSGPHDRLAAYAELYCELGGYPYDRDPGRPVSLTAKEGSAGENR